MTLKSVSSPFVGDPTNLKLKLYGSTYVPNIIAASNKYKAHITLQWAKTRHGFTAIQITYIHVKLPVHRSLSVPLMKTFPNQDNLSHLKNIFFLIENGTTEKSGNW